MIVLRAIGLMGPALTALAVVACAVGQAQLEAQIRREGGSAELREKQARLGRQLQAALGPCSEYVRSGLNKLEEEVRKEEESEEERGEGHLLEGTDLTGGRRRTWPTS